MAETIEEIFIALAGPRQRADHCLLTPLATVFAFQGVFRSLTPSLSRSPIRIGMAGSFAASYGWTTSAGGLQMIPAFPMDAAECCEQCWHTSSVCCAHGDAVPIASEGAAGLPLDYRNILAGKAGRGIDAALLAAFISLMGRMNQALRYATAEREAQSARSRSR